MKPKRWGKLAGAAIEMTEIAAPPSPGSFPKNVGGAASLRVAMLALILVVWISAALFGIYIVAFYGGAATTGELAQWNKHLPDLYEPRALSASLGIGFHFMAGAILLVLGPVQFVGAIRNSAPALHRWIGRVYTIAALIAGLGGLTFIAVQGTVGGTPMNIGFGLYGALMVLASVQTMRKAMKRDLVAHRAWAIRLFALAIGSWLYRMDYGFWTPLTGGAGHTKTFDGPFDVVMSFFFFLPNLAVAEVFIRKPRLRAGLGIQLVTALVLCSATVFLAVATYYFTRFYWGPDILARLRG